MLAWEVVTNKGNVEVEVCDAMLDHRATLLKRTRRVTFLANCGFHERAWASKIAGRRLTRPTSAN